MYKYILFDLDGTLTDPGVGITNSVIYALEKFGIAVEDRSSLYKFIGPPLKDSFEEYYGFSERKALEAVKYYREYFVQTGMFENEIYPGAEDLLYKLKQASKKLILATSKPQSFAERILEHFGLTGYFDCITGSAPDGSLVNKQDVIALALKRGEVDDLSLAVMIGDRKYDILGAAHNKIDSVGVLYGYGDKEELLAAGAVCFAEKVEDIPDIIL